MEDFFIVIIGYFVVFVLSLIILNMLTKGFLLKFLKVKGSRGKKILVRVHDKTNIYYAVGGFKKKVLIFKDHNKETHNNPDIPNDFIYSFLGVTTLEYDLVNSSVMTPNFQRVKGIDSNDVDEMIQRALMLKNLGSQDKILILGLILIGIVVIIGFYITNTSLTEAIELIKALKVGVV